MCLFCNIYKYIDIWGIDDIPHWNLNGTTPTFGGSFRNYEYSQYFDFQENPDSILNGEILREFDRKVRMKDNHHNYR